MQRQGSGLNSYAVYRIKDELLKTVRQKLLDIMGMTPGRERRQENLTFFLHSTLAFASACNPKVLPS